MPSSAAAGDKAEESFASIRRPAHADLNHSGIVDMKIRLAGSTRPGSKLSSRSLNRLQSHRSARSQKSLEALEKGWNRKFKMAKALEEKPIAPLHRLPSDRKIVNQSFEKLEQEK